MDKRQIILFTGLRRVGKTTLMYQIMDELIKRGKSPYNILYFSFDEMKYDLNAPDVFKGNCDIMRQPLWVETFS
ncbi:MAG: AAA family ATPase [Deferribacteres bacterium]|nr:AAA family ATPase [Deferribacteres bacterium]